MILADLTLTDVLWSMLVFFFIFMLIMIFFQIVTDLFRNKEMSGVVKAIWIIALIFITPLTMLIYLIVEGRGMAERQQAAAADAQQQYASYVKSVAGSEATPADQIAKAKELLDQGAITQADFDALKAKALA